MSASCISKNKEKAAIEVWKENATPWVENYQQLIIYLKWAVEFYKGNHKNKIGMNFGLREPFLSELHWVAVQDFGKREK